MIVSKEEIAAAGLNIRGFHFKWKHAKQYESKSPRTDDTRLLPYWERVRLTFLELGGEYSEKATRTSAHHEKTDPTV